VTQVRSRLVVPGAVLAAAGFVALLAGLTQAGLLTAVLADFGALGLGWSTVLEAFVGGWAATHLEDFAQLISRERARMAKLVRDAGIKADQ